MGAINGFFHTDTSKDICGLEGIRQMFSEFYDTFPDNHMTLEDMVVEGDKIALRYTITGTHKDTHKEVTMSAIEICRIVSGKFVECWQARVSP
jgi:predicted ester cyclase